MTPHATVGCSLTLSVQEQTDAVLSVAPAARPTSEQLVVTLDGAPVAYREVAAHHGNRLHVATLGPGLVQIRYDAQLPLPVGPRPVEELDAIVARRPSRYCPSDQLVAFAFSELGPVDATTVQRAVTWVRERIVYDATASRPVDSAIDTLLTGKGVCRDVAHLLVALLRAQDIPARVVSVYAPGLSPMDFHAVVEVAVDGVWELHDPTGMASRPAMLRIATGRDAADTAFLTLTGGASTLDFTEVWAWTDGVLPVDAVTQLA